jgi:hypothetical protein
VHADDLRDVFGREREHRPAREGLRHLQESGLLERIPLESRDRDVVVLTGRGRDVLGRIARSATTSPGNRSTPVSGSRAS